MWRALVFAGLTFGWVVACSSTSKNTDTVCNPKSTQSCAASGCVGVQTCIDDGSDWGPCQCGTGGTGGSAGSSSGGTSSGGTSSGGASAAGGVAGTSGSGGVAGGCSAFSECTEIVPCCEAEHPQAKQLLKTAFDVDCDTVSGLSTECMQACNGGKASDDMAQLVACLMTLDSSQKAELFSDCSCPELSSCLGACGGQ